MELRHPKRYPSSKKGKGPLKSKRTAKNKRAISPEKSKEPEKPKGSEERTISESSNDWYWSEFTLVEPGVERVLRYTYEGYVLKTCFYII